jgi:hypothetical protein
VLNVESKTEHELIILSKEYAELEGEAEDAAKNL